MRMASSKALKEEGSLLEVSVRLSDKNKGYFRFQEQNSKESMWPCNFYRSHFLQEPVLNSVPGSTF